MLSPIRAFLALFFLFVMHLATAGADPISIASTTPEAIGRSAEYFEEGENRLDVRSAIIAYREGRYKRADSPILNFGIGARPVWLRFEVDNATSDPLSRRLAIENAWLDRVEVYFQHAGGLVASYVVGDTKAYAQRPVNSRFFKFDQAFPPGRTEIYIRVQTPDPMVVPVYLLDQGQDQARMQQQDYSYGFLYGFLAALMAFNAFLYFGLRQPRYLHYALYMGLFMLMNISYTGHGLQWLWPEMPQWAQWSHPVLMYLYATGGLLFAQSFLDTRRHCPRMNRGVTDYVLLSGVLLALSVAISQQLYALLIAFSYVFLFTCIMLVLGVMSVRAGYKPARYFLIAAMLGMVGAFITTLAVWGYLPYTVWTYRAVEIGMIFDATLLALALTYQFRVSQEDKLRAEQLARLDPLTGLDNRRAFHDKAPLLWSAALRHDRPISVILMDIDRFKQINDGYGHAYGDTVLVEIGKLLAQVLRGEDLAARWGGEEFILLLPDTDLDAGIALAERLRTGIAALRIAHPGGEIPITASFGVAQIESYHFSLESLISAADQYLYQAKDAGRNRVSSSKSDAEAS